MKKIKYLFNFLVFFVVGYLIFNTIYSAIKVFIINNIGGHEAYLNSWIIGFKETFLVYLVIYLIIIILDTIYKKITIKKLNNELKNINGRGEKNE